MRKLFKTLWENFFFRIVVYLVAFAACGVLQIGLGHVSSHLNDQTGLLKQIIDYLGDALSLGAVVTLIIGAVKKEIKEFGEKRDEERAKAESDQHKIICRYYGHEKQDVTQDNYSSKEGYYLSLHSKHLNRKKLALGNLHQHFSILRWKLNKSKYSFEPGLEIESFSDFMNGPKTKDKPEPYVHKEAYLNIANLNVFANYNLDTHLSVVDDYKKVHELPEFVQENGTNLLGAHAYSATSNNTTIRLNDFTYDSKTHNLKIFTERSNYYQMLLTNRCMDYSVEGATLRNVYEYHRTISALDQSQLGNQIGVNGLVMTTDGYFIVEHRGLKKTTWKDKFGQPISFALEEWKMFDDAYGKKQLTDENVEEKILGRIDDSLRKTFNLLPGEDYYPLEFSKNFMGIARDMLEGGKPNLYFYVIVKYDAATLVRKLQEYASFTSAVGKRKPLRNEKIQGSHWYLVKHDEINVDYHYKMVMPRSSYTIKRRVWNRCWFPAVKPNWIFHRYLTPYYFRRKEIGEALLACFAYYEVLEDKILLEAKAVGKAVKAEKNK